MFRRNRVAPADIVNMLFPGIHHAFDGVHKIREMERLEHAARHTFLLSRGGSKISAQKIVRSLLRTIGIKLRDPEDHSIHAISFPINICELFLQGEADPPFAGDGPLLLLIRFPPLSLSIHLYGGQQDEPHARE